MYLKPFFATVILVSHLSPAAQAIEWSPIIKTVAYEIFVDIDSYKVLSGKPYMTTKTVFNSPQTHLMNPKSIHYSMRLEQKLFDCQQPQYKLLNLQLLDASEQVVYTAKQPHQFEPIVTGSDTFSIGQLTCQVHQMLGGQ